MGNRKHTSFEFFYCQRQSTQRIFVQNVGRLAIEIIITNCKTITTIISLLNTELELLLRNYTYTQNLSYHYYPLLCRVRDSKLCTILLLLIYGGQWLLMRTLLNIELSALHLLFYYDYKRRRVTAHVPLVPQKRKELLVQ